MTWVCRSTEGRRFYRAEEAWAVRHNRLNTDRPEHAARYATREEADRARPLGDATVGEPVWLGEEDNDVFCFPPGQWEAAPAPPEPPALPGFCLVTNCFCKRSA